MTVHGTTDALASPSPTEANAHTYISSVFQPEPPQETMEIEKPQGPHLPTVLGTRDLTIFMILIVLFISNINGAQIGGPAAFLYWLLGIVTFLIPGAFVTQWLARRFSGQGAPYLWAAQSLGKNWSFFAAFCAWIPGMLSVVSAIEAGIVFVQLLFPSWFTTPQQQCVAIIALLVVATCITCIPLRILKRVMLCSVLAYLCVFALITGAGIYWVASGHTPATALNIPSQWQFNSNNFAVYGLVILALLGVDIPLFMSGEVRDGRKGVRRASNYVWWGAIISAVAYLGGTFGIMVIIPPSQSGNISASILAIQSVYGPLAGTVATVVLVVSQLTITIAYLLMFSRILFIIAGNQRLPQQLARVNRRGVPVVSIVVQAAITAFVTLLAFVVVPILFSGAIRPEDLAYSIYNILLAGASAMWSFSTALLFFFIITLIYRRNRHLMASKAQRGLLAGASFVGTAASLVGIWSTVSSSWVPSLISDDRWAVIVWTVIIATLAVGGISSELPRLYAMLNEQKRVNHREVLLREELQHAYDEQKVLVEQQQELLSEVDRLYREQAQAAVTDAITGLPNHRAVMSRLDEELSRCQRGNATCAILFLDIDHFKQVNDTWGHRAGDMILREVAARLRNTLRMEDFVGRYGGEEFAIVLTDTDISMVTPAAERLRVAVNANPYHWEVELSGEFVPIHVTASIGAAVYGLHGTTREALLEHADQAMYLAKHSGRNCVRIADVDIEPGDHLATSKSEPSGRDEQTKRIFPVQTVQALTAAASAHDRATDDHAHRMLKLAAATAREMQRPEEEMHLLQLAALLHDIGKIGIPDAILHKPGPLNDEEWAVMRRHPEIGRQILTQVGGIFQHLSEIVVAHHERWDGTGYPRGLAGEDIPMSARILSVVDSFDAMTSRRVYRDPFTVEQARAELLRCSGSQYDPEVVAAFLRILDSHNTYKPVLEASTQEQPLEKPAMPRTETAAVS